jgi:phosphoglycolate phosphatase
VKARFSVSAVAIDLDGTLLDTIGEITLATNLMLAAQGLPELPDDEVRDMVGKGVARLVRRALAASTGSEPDEVLISKSTDLFRERYEAILGHDTAPYDGVVEGLDRFRAMGLGLACITNKIERFTMPLLERAGLAEYFGIVVSGDTLPRPKPHPDPLLHVAAHFGIAPSGLLMLGDSGNDAQAARAAGCPVLVVPYGYNEGAPVDDLDCDGIIHSLAAAADLIEPLRKADPSVL